MRIYKPATEGELESWLAERATVDEPIVVSGGVVERPPAGLEPTPRVVVSTAALDQVTELRTGDLTITVGAGMRVSELGRVVRERGLWLPHADGPEDRSVGGLVAGAPPSELDAAVGPVRRQVLACTIVGHTGRRTRWGRAVMKNVAGYDLVRLICGSRGRLGIITTVTFRLWPRPPAAGRFRLHGRRGLEILADPRAPQCDAVQWRESEDGGMVAVTVLGHASAVREKEATLRRWAEERELEVEAVDEDTGVEDGTAPSGRAQAGALRAPTTASYRVAFGRRYVHAGVDRLRGLLEMTETAGTLAAYPGGVVVARLRGLPAAGHRPAPAWLSDLIAEGRATPAVGPTLDEPGIRIDRGGPEEHAAARRLQAGAARHIEERVVHALGGREVPWQAEYL